MRNFDRSVIASVLVLAGVAAAPIIACSSDNSDTPDGGSSGGDEGGITPLPDGALPDGAIVDPPKKCAKAADCPSGVCNLATGLCSAASCKDGSKNANETDVDCGGDCPKCDAAKACKVAADCTAGVCKDTGTGLKCQAPSNTDGVKNGNETGIDCGGPANPKCADGKTCKLREDCTSGYCKAGICSAVTPDDGILNGTETDIDCGGPAAKQCVDGLMCLADGDCTSNVCTGGKCQVPSPTDHKKNGTETDVDCGGGGANPGCAAGLVCLATGDCASLGCDYNNKCAIARSCTAHYGGDTCGTGGAGGIGAQAWESCCTTLPVTTDSGGTVYMDKYPTTAGRMRVFLESVGYDVRTAVQGLRAAGAIPVIPVTAATGANPVIDGVKPVLDESWDPFLPTSFGGSAAANEIPDCSQSGTCALANGECPPSTTCIAGQEQPGIYTAVRNHLGGNIFKNNAQTSTGCFVGGPGVHSFRFPAGMQDGANPEQPVEVYDTKTLNCVDYLMAQSFCVWDGGRLETFQEWQTAYGLGATPWGPVDTRTPVSIGSASYFGCRFPWATDADQSQCGTKWGPGVDNRTNQLADYQYSYEYPKLGSQDYIVHLTAPGRTAGRGPLGHSDLLGTGFELTSSVTSFVWNKDVPNSGPFQSRHRWTGNGSWEVHGYNRSYTGTSELLNKYGKLGLRCVKFAP